ncbi:unnamed protein product [Ixodes pacificus]
MPALSSTAKSPAPGQGGRGGAPSWGNSSQTTATEMLAPARRLSEKAAPMERPSMKLCMPSPKITIQATAATLSPGRRPCS